MTPQAQDIVKADIRYRHVVFGVYAVLTIVLVAVTKYGIPALRTYLCGLNLIELLRALRILFVLILASFMPPALYLVYVGRRILSYGTYPYPGCKVMFDTQVIRGAKAHRRGWSLVILGTLCLVLTTMSIIYTYVRITGWIRDPKIQRYFGRRTAIVSEFRRQPSLLASESSFSGYTIVERCVQGHTLEQNPL